MDIIVGCFYSHNVTIRIICDEAHRLVVIFSSLVVKIGHLVVILIDLVVKITGLVVIVKLWK